MSLPVYMDVHVRRAVTNGLRARGVDVLTAQEDGAEELPDPELMNRALSLGRFLFTQDEDFLVEVAQRQARGERFPTVVYAHQMVVTVRQCIEGIELLSKTGSIEEVTNHLVFLPF